MGVSKRECLCVALVCDTLGSTSSVRLCALTLCWPDLLSFSRSHTLHPADSRTVQTARSLSLVSLHTHQGSFLVQARSNLDAVPLSLASPT